MARRAAGSDHAQSREGEDHIHRGVARSDDHGGRRKVDDRDQRGEGGARTGAGGRRGESEVWRKGRGVCAGEFREGSADGDIDWRYAGRVEWQDEEGGDSGALRGGGGGGVKVVQSQYNRRRQNSGENRFEHSKLEDAAAVCGSSP